MGRRKSKNIRRDAALSYAEIDLAVLPLCPRGKEPRTPHGYLDATTDAAQIREWWSENPDYNIGIATGQKSGIVVVDYDREPPKGTPLALTPTAESGGKGNRFHKYFAVSGPMASGKFEFGDVLADGRYAVAPPSIHESGESYAWIPFLSPWDCALADISEFPIARGGGASPITRRGGEARKSILLASVNPATPPNRALGCATSDWPFKDLARDPAVAFQIMRACGREVNRLGQKFLCPLHSDTRPSAALWKPEDKPDGIICLHDFHSEQQWVPLADIYAACVHHSRIPLTTGVRPLYWLRCLDELGRITIPEIEHAPLDRGASRAERRLYERFVYLLRCREVYRPGQLADGAPFSWRFAAPWCGIGSTATISTSMKSLLGKGFLIRSGFEIPTDPRLTFLKLGDPFAKQERERGIAE